MRGIKVTFGDGNTISTSINGTLAEIHAYYMGNGQVFNFGDTDEHPKDNMQHAVSIECLDGEEAGKAIAYVFPNGFMKEAINTYTHLRHYNLTPSWGNNKDGSQVIMLPARELNCLRLMQRHNPASFGNPPEGWTETPSK